MFYLEEGVQGSCTAIGARGKNQRRWETVLLSCCYDQKQQIKERTIGVWFQRDKSLMMWSVLASRSRKSRELTSSAAGLRLAN